MKDLDFDELDKAVNSLMGGVSASAKEEDPLKTLEINTTLADDEKPAYDRIQKAAARIGSETIEVPSSKPERILVVPASRRAGRFMDVMHPSSDMKVTGSATAPIAQPAIVQPTPMSIPTRNTPIVPAPTVIVSPAPVTPETVPLVMQSVPEPTVDHTELPQLEPVVAQPAITTVPVESAIEQVSYEELTGFDEIGPEPQVSPFLADAKVEKRPLGVQQDAPAVAVAQEIEAPFAETVEHITETDFQLATTVDMPLPEEFHEDLLAIETKGADEVSPLLPVDTLTPQVAKTTPLSGPSSIAQQYKVEASSGDQSNGSIYDVDSYHKPLRHPASKSSGWLWVLLIVIILVACGAGAAAFFLLTK